MENVMPNASSGWMLYTRTSSVDYFWLNDHGEKVMSAPVLYYHVTDESDMRTGYFCSSGGTLEMSVNLLDAQRQDRLGRSISLTIILRAKITETAKADFIRCAFAEAITNSADDPAAAVLARSLRKHWESMSGARSASPCDWFDFARGLHIDKTAMVANKSIESGFQYTRDESVLAAFAAKALRQTGDILLLCAGTQSPGRIFPVPGYERIPASLCSLSASEQKLSSAMADSSDPIEKIKNMVGDANEKISNLPNLLKGIFLVAILLLIAVFVVYLWPRQSVPVQDNSATPSRPDAVESATVEKKSP